MGFAIRTLSVSSSLKAVFKLFVLSALGAALLLALAWAVIEYWWRPFPDSLPWMIYAAAYVPLLCITYTAAVRIVLWIARRKLGVKSWVLLLMAVLLSFVNLAAVTNAVFKSYPTMASVLPSQYAVSMSYDEFRVSSQQNTPPTAFGRTVGAVVTTDIVGEKSAFHARNAEVYIPPAYWEHPDLRLPVIVLMAGNPGSPNDWVRSGDMLRIADDYQGRHNGISPIVVSADATGSFSANPICVDSPVAKVQTYISEDVPTQLKKKFRVDTLQKNWVIGGLSYGGTCALQIVTNAPQSYGTFLDFSGQKEPTIGQHDETVRKFFAGDEAAFDTVNPENILTAAATDKTTGTSPFQGIAGQFIAGDGDVESVKALTHLHTLAQQAGMDTTISTVPGKHDFATWRQALQQSFAWAASRQNLHKIEGTHDE